MKQFGKGLNVMFRVLENLKIELLDKKLNLLWTKTDFQSRSIFVFFKVSPHYIEFRFGNKFTNQLYTLDRSTGQIFLGVIGKV